jgi:hypothetical protein
MPCASSGACGFGGNPETGECDDGLTCTAIEDLGARCLKQCSSDDDCAVPGVLRCGEDGLCRP